MTRNENAPENEKYLWVSLWNKQTLFCDGRISHNAQGRYRLSIFHAGTTFIYRHLTDSNTLEYFCVAFAAFINYVIRIQWHGANAFIRDVHALISRNGAQSTCKLYTKCKTMRYGYPASGFQLGARKRHRRN